MQPSAVLSVLVTANTAQANAALAKTEGAMRSMAGTASPMGARVAQGLKVASLAAVGVGVVTGKMAIDFDKDMRNVNSIAQLSESQFQDLEKRVLALAGPTAQAPGTLAKGLYDLVSSGFDANQSMTILRKSALAATAGLTTTEVSTKAVAAVLNAYRMPATDAGKVSDLLFKTVDRGVITFESLAGSIGGILPAASTLGIDLAQVGASVSTLTKEGQSGEMAMVNLNAAMTALFKPSESMKGVLKGLGVESAESLIKANGFQGALEKVIGATDGSKEAIGELFPNVRALRAVFGLTGDNAASAAADIAEFKDSGGATAKALEQQSKSVAFQWNQTKAEASALAIEIGQKLLPAFHQILGGVMAVVKVFSGLPTGIVTATIALVALGYPIMKTTILITRFATAVGLLKAATTATSVATASAGVTAATAADQFGINAARTRAMGEAGRFASLGFMGPVGLGVGVGIATAAVAYFLIKATEVPSTIEKIRKTSEQLQFEFVKQANAHHAVADAQQVVVHWAKIIQNLEEQGLSGSKRWVSAIHSQAEAQLALNDAQRAQASSAAAIADKIPELTQDLADLRRQQKENADLARAQPNLAPTMEQQTQAARDLAEAIEKLRGAQVNAKRAAKGFQPIPEDAMHRISTFRDTFGKALTLKIGMIRDPKMVSDLLQMSNQLAFLGKPHKVEAILSDKTLSTGQQMAAIRQVLLRLTGGKYTINMDSQDLVTANKRLDVIRNQGGKEGIMTRLANVARADMKSLGGTVAFESKKINAAIKSGKDPTNQLAASYGNLMRKVKQAMDANEMNVRRGNAVILQLLAAQLRVLGATINVSPAQVNKYHAQQNAGKIPDLIPTQALGGTIVPGMGSGDTVPLHIGGQLAAFVEPGELVSVNNRTSTAQLMAHNQAVPRRAGGGTIPSFSGPGPGVLDDIAAAALNKEATTARAVLAHLAATTAGTPGPAGGPAGTTSYKGVTMARWVAMALQYASSKGAAPQPTSGYRSHAYNVSQGRNYTSEHEFTRYPRGAVDFGGMVDPPALPKKMSVVNATRSFRYKLLAPIGFRDDGHASGTGHMRGGVVGFQGGGIVRPKHGDHWAHVAAASSPAGTRATVDEGATLLWQAGLSESQAGELSRVIPGESGGDIHAHNPSGATGLFQILGAVVGGNLNDPRINALNAAKKYRDAGNSLGPWEAAPSGPAGKILREMVMTAGGKDTPIDKSKKKGAEWSIQLPPWMTAQIANYAGLADRQADYASRASSLEIPVDGKDEAGWLRAELDTLRDLRNTLIAARTWILNVIQMYQKAIEAAHEEIRMWRQAIDEARNIKDGKIKNWSPAVIKALGKKSDFINATGAIIPKPSDMPKAVKSFQDEIKGQQTLITKWTDHQGKSIALLDGDEGPIPKLTELQGYVTDASIEFVQGAIPPEGVLGGRIADVQSQLKQLNESTTTDTGSERADILQQLLTEANRRTEVGAAQFEVLKALKYLPTFATGGVLGVGQMGIAGETGKAELIQGPATILNPAATQQALTPPSANRSHVRVVVQDQRTRVYVDDKEIRAVVKDETKKQGRGLDRKMGGL